MEQGHNDAEISRHATSQDVPAETGSVQESLEDAEDGHGAREGLHGQSQGSLQEDCA